MFLSNPAMTAIIAHKESGVIYRIAEDHDDNETTPVWVERWMGKRWDWERMTTQPFAEVIREYNDQGYICLATED